MKPGIRLRAAVGVAVLFIVTGCSQAVTGAAVPESRSGAASTDAGKDRKSGFDECGLVEPAEVAKAIGVNAVHVTGRSAMTQSDGSRRAGCAYFPENVPGMLGLEIGTVADTDAERFFAPFAKNFRNVQAIPKLGDRAEAVAYKANGTSTHYIEVRTLSGNRGLHLFYTYTDGRGAMPKADGAAAAVILVTALERLPDEVTIPDGAPEGRCADVDLEPAAEVVGAKLVMARSVVSEGGGMTCHFSGGGGKLEVSLLADAGRAAKAAVPPDQITHADLADGVRVMVTEANALDARVNVGDQVVIMNASYAGEVTALRPADVELVRTVVDAISDRN
ncbi:hypothetical protein [Saccharothrix luteola]|uniref:hypothetical protein n=1 Tax=Saccharothrix luteola TaxID=2893018 RepID=UPI001E296FA1|nr:hypothetical protein [Saccharothrix luteola]MCC8250454.1 hypothetical protein [Saccharothrix luteola]